MNILILDTETNGLPQKWGADPKNFELFPEVLSIAFITWNTDTDETLEHYYVIDRPIEKWDKYAQEVNGFNEERLEDEGLPFSLMANDLKEVLIRTDLTVCHNTDFDLPILEADLIRNRYEFSVMGKPTYCTKEGTTELCQLPNSKGYGYKWPKLSELYQFLFDRDMEQDFNAHNALEDTKCTFECFKELVRRGYVDLDKTLA